MTSDRRRLRAPLAILALLLAGTVATPVLAQSDVRSLSDRLDRLERDVSNLYAGRGGAPASGGGPRGAGLDLQAQSRIDMIETQLRELTGQVERALYASDQLNKKLEKQQADVDYRLNALEKGQAGGAAPAGAPAPGPKPSEPPTVISSVTPRNNPATPPPPSSGASIALPNGTAAQQYDNAYQLLRQARYDEAGAAFRAFLQQNPEHAFSENAQYWLGETYYVRQKYDDAAKIFLEGFQKYPKGGKAPDNLLKLGMSFANLDKPKEACVALGKLREFPQAAATITARANSERTRLKCG